MLDKRKIDAIEYLIEDEKNDVDIAKLVGISPRQFARWKVEDEFVKEWQKRTSEIRHQAQKGFDVKLEVAKSKLWEIINDNVDVRTREKALEYWINRSLGTPTNKVETTTADNTNIDSNILEHLYNNNPYNGNGQGEMQENNEEDNE